MDRRERPPRVRDLASELTLDGYLAPGTSGAIVGPSSALQEVPTATPPQEIVPRPAQEEVVTIATDQPVIATTASQSGDALPAEEAWHDPTWPDRNKRSGGALAHRDRAADRGALAGAALDPERPANGLQAVGHAL